MMRFINKFRRSESGVSAIEFALIIPVMLFTFFGVAEISRYILAARKVANVASIAADLVAQDKSIDNGEMANIFGAIDVVLRPFNASEAKVRVSSVVADANGQLKIDWSDARHTSPRAPGSNAPSTIPAGLIGPGQGLIMSEVEFTYTSLFGMYTTGGMTVDDTFYLKPRRSSTVERE